MLADETASNGPSTKFRLTLEVCEVFPSQAGGDGMSGIGPARQIVHCSDTSGIGGYADFARTVVNVRVQPRHASLIGGGPRSSSGSLAKFTAMRRAS
jgi:hypothetical protein